ncbi:uncharacterized protein N7482_003105 [Penicillium canariense]|uniref:Uncharacterized protein n=1 Tax=Penicillium canariense TaxID=189055 RepID=A0A9W9LUJ2_9EURO|nr:uncharacterized protein N7482_003105 [Penicillium canariense]KAJ5177228.1 hypothetical protein N7482_003105 [Penicillium canariense]
MDTEAAPAWRCLGVLLGVLVMRRWKVEDATGGVSREEVTDCRLPQAITEELTTDYFPFFTLIRCCVANARFVAPLQRLMQTREALPE